MRDWQGSWLSQASPQSAKSVRRFTKAPRPLPGPTLNQQWQNIFCLLGTVWQSGRASRSMTFFGQYLGNRLLDRFHIAHTHSPPHRHDQYRLCICVFCGL